MRRLRLRSDSKGGCGCPFYSPDGLWIGKARVPWTLISKISRDSADFSFSGSLIDYWKD